MTQLLFVLLAFLPLAPQQQQPAEFVIIEHIGDEGIEGIVISTQQVTKPHTTCYIVSEASFQRIKRIVADNKSAEIIDPIEYGSFRFSVMLGRSVKTSYSIDRGRSAQVFRQLIAFTEKQVYDKLTKKLRSVYKRIAS